VADLRAALDKRPGRLVLVDSPAQADIAVGIVERVIADSKSSVSLFPPRYDAARSIVRLRATVTRAGESAELMGGRWRESDAQGWVWAARDIAAAIDAWIVHQSLRPGQAPREMLVPWPDGTGIGFGERRARQPESGHHRPQDPTKSQWQPVDRV